MNFTITFLFRVEGAFELFYWRLWVLHEGTWKSPRIPSQAYWTGEHFIERVLVIRVIVMSALERCAYSESNVR